MCAIFSMITEYEDTIATIYDDQPKVIIAASGMLTGGRVLSYLERYIVRPETTVIIVGFQAEGTRGRKLLDGEKEIKLYGKYYPVAAKIVEIEGLSAHGDQDDLLNWLSKLEKKPQTVFLVHGETEALVALKSKIEERYEVNCEIPYQGQTVEIN
jgi:metallo-beta-lactamase family protein